MHTSLAALAIIIAMAFGTCPGAAVDDEGNELTQKLLTLEELPPRVADTLRSALGNKRPGEIKEVRCEGIPILYEAEYTDDRRRVEAVITPDGARVPAGQVKGRSPVRERKIQFKDLPAA